MRSHRGVVVLALALAALATTPAAARSGPVQLGSAVNELALFGSDDRYGQTAAGYDAVTSEAGMKIGALQPQRGVFDFATADRTVDWAKAHGQVVHGHTLAWCADEWAPAWLTSTAWTRDELLGVLRDHVTTVMRHFAGRVPTWDVVNEPFNNDGSRRDCVWSRVIGPDWVEQALRFARAADPGARLFVNEYRAEAPAGSKFRALEALLTDLRGKGLVDGAGLQLHIYGVAPLQYQLQESIRRLGALALDVHLSELDDPISFFDGATTAAKLDQQGTAYRTVAQACQAEPACFRISTWGFTDAFTYKGSPEMPLPFDADYRPKPAWQALQRALRATAPTAGDAAPPAPVAPSAAAASRGALTISWPTVADPEGDAVTYTLQNRDADDADWSTVATGLGTTSFAFTSSRLQYQGSWRYRVLAEDGHQAGAWSAESAVSVVDRVAPRAPALAASRAFDVAGPPGWWRDAMDLLTTAGTDPALPDGSPGSGVDPATVAARRTIATNGLSTQSATVTDRATNTSPAGTLDVRVDALAPAAKLTCPATAVRRGTTAKATWSASDGESGLTGAAAGSVALDTRSTGTKTARVQVTDRVGHPRAVTCAYTVR